MELTIELNQQCALQCRHCSSSRGDAMLSLRYIQSILTEFDVEQIILSGGEPLLHPQIREIINTLTRDYVVSLYTSGMGSLPDQELRKLHKIYVSIYGWEDFHNTITQLNSFKQSLYFLISVGIQMKMCRNHKEDVLINSPIFGIASLDLVAIAKTGDFPIRLTRLLPHGRAAEVEVLPREDQVWIATQIRDQYTNTIISQSLLYQHCNWRKKLTLLPTGQITHCVAGKWQPNANQEFICDKIKEVKQKWTPKKHPNGKQ